MTEATISRNSISIRIPIRMLQALVDDTSGAGRLSERIKITDPQAFAREIVSVLNEGDESGASIIENMLDAAISEAVGGGAEGFEIHPKQEGHL